MIPNNFSCKIPECSNDQQIYNQDWVPYAIPLNNNGKPSKCLQYKFEDNEHNDSHSSSNSDDNRSCSIHNFNRSQIIQCPIDDLLYETDEITISNEVIQYFIYFLLLFFYKIFLIKLSVFNICPTYV